jgi:hypothetical protein
MIQVIFTVCVALLFAQTANAALSNVSVVFSNPVKDRQTDITVTFTAATPGANTTIVIPLTNTGYAFFASSLRVTQGSLTTTTATAVMSGSPGSQLITVSAASWNTGSVSFVVTGFYNPGTAFASRPGLTLTAGGDTGTFTLPAITKALSAVSVSVANQVALAASGAVTVTFTPTSFNTAVDKLIVYLPGFTATAPGALGAVTFSGAVNAGTATPASATFTAAVSPVPAFITLTFGTNTPSSALPATYVIAAPSNAARGLKNPATAQAASTSINVKSQLLTDDIDSTTAGSLVAITKALGSFAITLDKQGASATAVTASVSFTAAQAVAAGQLVVSLPGYVQATAGTLTVTAVSGVTFAAANTATIGAASNGVALLTIPGVTINISGTAVTSVSFTILGLVNPTAAQLASSTVSAKTQTTNGAADIDSTVAGSLVAITTALASPSIALSSQLFNATAVNATIVFTNAAANDGASSLVVPLANFANATAGLTATATGGAAATSAGSVAASLANGVLTVSGFSLTAANGASTIVVSGLMNPVAVQAAASVQLKIRLGTVDKESAILTLPAITATAAPTPTPTAAPTPTPAISASPSLKQGLSYAATAGAAVAALML